MSSKELMDDSENVNRAKIRDAMMKNGLIHLITLCEIKVKAIFFGLNSMKAKCKRF
tara:strand:+ start:696 stop:863 length:168 start_codon:yes stop_codon:yes gene_type:complete